MKMNLKRIDNNRGAVVISTLILISVMIVIMIGMASVQLLQVAKDSKRANNAYKYLSVMEEMGQMVARMRQQGREFDRGTGACPSTSPAATSINSPTNTIHVCLSGASMTTTCITRTDSGLNENFCLESIVAIDAANANADLALNDPGVGAVPAGPATEAMTPSTSLNSDYHNTESWFPSATTVIWPVTNANEIRTPLCGVNTQIWQGCLRCTWPGVTCMEFKVCPAEQGTGCANPYVQRIAVY